MARQAPLNSSISAIRLGISGVIFRLWQLNITQWGTQFHAIGKEAHSSPVSSAPGAGEVHREILFGHGKSPRLCFASATREMPRVSAASRRLNLNLRFWYSTECLALSSIAKSLARTSSRDQ